MKLFDRFEAVKFPEENLIFITDYHSLSYIYEIDNDHWEKYYGEEYFINTKNYPDVTVDEMKKAMDGIIPTNEIDFKRKSLYSLNKYDLEDVIIDDYKHYTDDYYIRHIIYNFMEETYLVRKSYEAIRALLDNAINNNLDNETVIEQIKELSMRYIGRNIFKKEIKIVDGHDSSSYFWIKPVKVINYNNKISYDDVAELNTAEISIEEEDVGDYLYPFLKKHFEKKLEENINRCVDEESDEPIFEWYLTYNFFTFKSVNNMLRDIRKTIDDLRNSKKTYYTRRILATFRNEPIDIELVIDFYKRFIYRMEYMLKMGEEKGFELISFTGP